MVQFANSWPVEAMIHQYLQAKACYLKKKARKNPKNSTSSLADNSDAFDPSKALKHYMDNKTSLKDSDMSMTSDSEQMSRQSSPTATDIPEAVLQDSVKCKQWQTFNSTNKRMPTCQKIILSENEDSEKESTVMLSIALMWLIYLHIAWHRYSDSGQ